MEKISFLGIRPARWAMLPFIYCGLLAAEAGSPHEIRYEIRCDHAGTQRSGDHTYLWLQADLSPIAGRWVFAPYRYADRYDGTENLGSERREPLKAFQIVIGRERQFVVQGDYPFSFSYEFAVPARVLKNGGVTRVDRRTRNDRGRISVGDRVETYPCTVKILK